MKFAWKKPPLIVVVAKVELAEMLRVVAAKLVEVIEVARVFTKTVVVAKRLVDVMLAPEILAGLKLEAVRLVALSVVKKPLVEVMDVAKRIVEVMAVPEAEVKNNGPVRVPPASGR